MNMALDLVLQDSLLKGHGGPTLHIYQWSPQAVSLGRMQKAEASLDLEACRRDGIDVVRRPTGGRAVMHGRDFTFSIVARADGLIPRGVLASYAVLSRITSRALAALGLEASTKGTVADRSTRSACFSSATRADLTVGGRKILGGAQRWEGPVLVQQNSILCASDHERTLRYIRPGRSQSSDAALRELRLGTVALDEALDSLPTHKELTQALSEAFIHEFKIETLPDAFTEVELALASKLAATGAC